MPILKLTKDDWNVKCWEDRLRRKPANVLRTRTGQVDVAGRSAAPATRLIKQDERQQAVFNERIEDISSKLDKVREGAPQDEELARLMRHSAANANAATDRRRQMDWISQLKDELQTGAHNSRVLREQVAKKFENPTMEQNSTNTSTNTTTDSVYHRKLAHLGRPIRRLNVDDDDDDDH